MRESYPAYPAYKWGFVTFFLTEFYSLMQSRTDIFNG